MRDWLGAVRTQRLFIPFPVFYSSFWTHTMTAALPFKVCFQTHEVPPSALSTQQLPGHRHNPGRQHQGGAGRLSPRGSAMAAPTTSGPLLWGRRHLGRGPGGGERSGAERRGNGRLPGGGRGNGPGGLAPAPVRGAGGMEGCGAPAGASPAGGGGAG